MASVAVVRLGKLSESNCLSTNKIVAVKFLEKVNSEIVLSASQKINSPFLHANGRLLKTKDNRVVTLAYWQQEETTSSDNIPYFSIDENSHQWK